MSARPSPGELWEKTMLDPDGKRFVCSEACCFIYEKDKKLYTAWLGGTMSGVGEVGEGMIDGEDGWRRVYSPPTLITLGCH
ncbi:MAG: hypothetical protein AAB497_02160 [Patescibacteria group bacterium]